MSQIIIEDGGMKAIMADPKLEAARRKLSFHEIRLIMQHAREDLHERAAHYEATITELSEKLDALQAVPASGEVGDLREALLTNVTQALWPILGGNHTDVETWDEIGKAVDSAIVAALVVAALNASGEE